MNIYAAIFVRVRIFFLPSCGFWVSLMNRERQLLRRRDRAAAKELSTAIERLRSEHQQLER